MKEIYSLLKSIGARRSADIVAAKYLSEPTQS